MMTITDAKYTKNTASGKEQTTGSMFCFVGRSNVGKSSLISKICGKKNLAYSSKNAGKTRLINFFDVCCKVDGKKQSFVLADLPGYGFFNKKDDVSLSWQNMMQNFFSHSTNLKLVFVLVDISSPPSSLDKIMLNYLQSIKIPFSIILTKCDKISRQQQTKATNTLAEFLQVDPHIFVLFSAKSGQNIETTLNLIEGQL